MRVDANTPKGRRTVAFLNGEKVAYAMWADDETGEVCQAVVVNGRAKIEDGKIVTEILRGTVTLKDLDDIS